MISVGDPFPPGTGVELGPEPALLIFFKSDCGTCQIALPVFQHWSSQVRVLGVSQDDRAATDAFMTEYGVEMETFLDAPDFSVSRAFDPEGVPALYLMSDGVVTWAGTGWSIEQATELANHIATIDGSDPVLVGADRLPPYRPG